MITFFHNDTSKKQRHVSRCTDTCSGWDHLGCRMQEGGWAKEDILLMKECKMLKIWREEISLGLKVNMATGWKVSREKGERAGRTFGAEKGRGNERGRGLSVSLWDDEDDEILQYAHRAELVRVQRATTANASLSLNNLHHPSCTSCWVSITPQTFLAGGGLVSPILFVYFLVFCVSVFYAWNHLWPVIRNILLLLHTPLLCLSILWRWVLFTASGLMLRICMYVVMALCIPSSSLSLNFNFNCNINYISFLNDCLATIYAERHSWSFLFNLMFFMFTRCLFILKASGGYKNGF